MKCGQKDTLSCPECRKVHEIPEGGVAKFKVNYTTSTLVDLIVSMDVIGDKPECTRCKENDHIDIDAVTKCVQCNDLYCRDCDQHHTRIHPAHMVLDLTGNKTQHTDSELTTVKRRVEYCDTHKTKPLEIYCKVDQCALCATCFVTDHSGHECMDIHKAAEENIKLIDELLEKSDKLVESYDQAILSTITIRTKMEQKADDVTNELNHDMNIAFQALHDEYTMGINLVAEKKATCTEQAEAHVEHLHMQKAITESTMSQLCVLKQHGHDVEIANMAKDIASKSKIWSAPEIPGFRHNITFNVYRGRVYDASIVFGKVDILRDIVQKTFKLAKPTVLKKTKLNVKDLKDLAVTSNHEAIATEWSTPASIYNKDLTLMTTFGEEFHYVATKDDKIYLTSHTDTVHIYSRDGTHSRDIKIPRLKECCGIAVNSKGELVICDRSTETVYHVDSSTGRLLTRSKPDSFRDPVYVAVNSKDVVIVSDFDLHRVVGMRRDGTELFRYGTEGRGQYELNNPCGLCTDTADNIIVADNKNHRVHLLGPDGRFIRYLLTSLDGLEYPRAVAVDKDGQLLVGNFRGNIWVVKYTE